MAERVGFEPTLEFPLNTLSKRAPSATRPSLRLESDGRNDSYGSFLRGRKNLHDSSAVGAAQFYG